MSVVGKLGYQETTIGWIPLQWSLGTVNDYVAALQAGVSVNSMGIETNCINGQVGILKTSAAFGGKFYAEQHKVVVPEEVGRVTTPVLKDRIIISRMNTPLLVGESGYVSENYPNLFLPDRLWQTIPSDYPHSQRWLSYWLQLPTIKRLISSSATGTSSTMKNISKNVLLSLPVPRTPLPEQQKIASILTAVDDKLDVIVRQIVAIKTLKQGLMQTLFTKGVGTQDATGRWVPHVLFKKCKAANYPDSWKMVSFENVAPIIRRPVEIEPDSFYPELGLRSFGKGTFHKPALPGTEVGNKRLFKIQPGDLLFSNVFAWEGSVAIARKEDEGRFGSHRYITCKVDNELANTSFVFRYITTPDGIELLKLASPGGAGRNRTLGLSALAAISVPLPPLDEQDKITEILDGVDAKLSALINKQTHYQTLKRGLMQKLLTGEWRVKLDDIALAA